MLDDYHALRPGTTKTIKQKPEADDEVLRDADNDSKRYTTGTKIFKVLNGLEYQGETTGYDGKSKLYHIKYEDGDLEDFYHNEV